MTQEGGGIAMLGNFWMVPRFILNSDEDHNSSHDLPRYTLHASGSNHKLPMLCIIATYGIWHEDYQYLG